MATSNKVGSEKMRIRLKAYDAELLEKSAEQIVETAKRTGSKVSGPIPLPTQKEIVTIYVLHTKTKIQESNLKWEHIKD